MNKLVGMGRDLADYLEPNDLSAATTIRQLVDHIESAREEFLDLLADAIQFDEEQDGDETGDHTRFVIITHWQHLADLAQALGIPGPKYLETWKHALDRAIAEPPRA